MIAGIQDTGAIKIYVVSSVDGAGDWWVVEAFTNKAEALRCSAEYKRRHGFATRVALYKYEQRVMRK